MKKINIYILLTVLLFACSNATNDNNETEKEKLGENTYEHDLSSFKSKIKQNGFVSDGKTPEPPSELFSLVKYESEVGSLDAYLSANVDTSRKNPIIIWAHGGFGGIGSWFWEYGSYTQPFVDAQIPVMCPSWRGENENPGEYEMFLGEVHDFKMAIDYAKELPYVDTNRIYVAGHSTGGTLAILVSLLSNDIRATFSFGGAPDIYAVVENGEGYGNTPFKYSNKDESFVRSSINYVKDIKNSIFYFEGEESFYPEYANEMESKATALNKPFNSIIIPGETHFSVVLPIEELIVQKILSDTTQKLTIDFTDSEVLELF
ncbi:alpha/beta fold hydrolase [Paracrocinitomix mangrovi]|uniref:alpha/beta hydrolase family protein n=1 Tax=Paracrocinitomix mangrovi TaxID=2862509 RepID=UPI001C8D7CB4|nr:alpha/beta fold hydrolase [Paracrocinitomix mangrovi]UKN00322.1 alpha/beta fold hydrolase [Paracrocinitomix mangrovi]